ncbi:hypothetical protein Sfulv_61470 [Streptomyces fulvorobeus]|uniref:Uncharacterized protein n=1 Tax=Streptomyces fulvorobeus TaxID=284028 RepID=A0A7J0CHX8_9ACTN|nr:hypothetical protein Sfulv_61470 [Streptomyces fulvorobeus]
MDHVLAEAGRQGPLLRAAAALQKVQGTAFEPEEVVGRCLALAVVAAAAERPADVTVLVAVVPRVASLTSSGSGTTSVMRAR